MVLGWRVFSIACFEETPIFLLAALFLVSWAWKFGSLHAVLLAAACGSVTVGFQRFQGAWRKGSADTGVAALLRLRAAVKELFPNPRRFRCVRVECAVLL